MAAVPTAFDEQVWYSEQAAKLLTWRVLQLTLQKLCVIDEDSAKGQKSALVERDDKISQARIVEWDTMYVWSNVWKVTYCLASATL